GRLSAVPGNAAGTQWGMAWARGRKIPPTMRGEVSPWPAETAAGERAVTTVPGGATTVTGRMPPAVGGMSGPVKARTTNVTADTVTARGALTLPRAWAAVPLKSTESSSPRMRTV